MAFISMTIAILGNASPANDAVSDRAREILAMRAAAHDVSNLLDRHALDKPGGPTEHH
jgi:hypothetical protein